MAEALSCEQLPLLKLLMHAAKHPSCTVNGILLGRAEGQAGGVRVTDLVPLFHASHHLAAPTQVALAQLEALTQQPGSNCSMVGYYHSDARMQSTDLPPAGKQVADQLSAHNPSSFILLLDNKRLAQFSAGEHDAQPFELLTKDGGRGWRRDPHTSISLAKGGWKELQQEFVSMCQRQLYAGLVDFDDHLDDVSKDYMNPGLALLGKMALPGHLM